MGCGGPGRQEPSLTDLPWNDGAGDKVLERYLAKDARGMLWAWETLPHFHAVPDRNCRHRPPVCRIGQSQGRTADRAAYDTCPPKRICCAAFSLEAKQTG